MALASTNPPERDSGRGNTTTRKANGMAKQESINARFGIVPPADDDDWAGFGYDGAADNAEAADCVTLSVWAEYDQCASL